MVEHESDHQPVQSPIELNSVRRHTIGTLNQDEDDRREKCSLTRELHPYHIFFVAIGAAIGMGFYVRTGQVEAIAGPGTVLLAYLFLGVLAMGIMQDLGRLLQVWPIGNPQMKSSR